MRRIIVLAMVALFLLSTTAFGGGSGSPVLPLKESTDGRGLGVGFGYNYVGSRLLDLNNFNRTEDDLEVTSLSQVYGEYAVQSSENRNIFVRVGAASYDLKFDYENTDDRIKMELDPGIYAGLKMNNLYPWKDVGNFALGIGYDVQINGSINEVDNVVRSGTVSDIDGTLYSFDGQNSVYMTAKYDVESLQTSLIPYLGVYHSWFVVGVLDDPTYMLNKATVTHEISGAFDALGFGLVLGLDVDISKYCNLNVEGRFVGEAAITTGATIKF